MFFQILQAINPNKHDQVIPLSSILKWQQRLVENQIWKEWEKNLGCFSEGLQASKLL